MVAATRYSFHLDRLLDRRLIHRRHDRHLLLSLPLRLHHHRAVAKYGAQADRAFELVWIDGGSMPQHQPTIGLIRSDEDTRPISRPCCRRSVPARFVSGTAPPPLQEKNFTPFML